MSYTQSLANSGLGTIIAIKVASSFVTIGEITDGPLSGRKLNTTDVTNFQSLAQEFKATLITSGDVKLSGNYVGTDAGQLAVETAFEAKATPQFQVTLPITGTQTTTGDVWTFNAIVEEWNSFGNLSPSKAVQFSGSLKISGLLSKTAGT